MSKEQAKKLGSQLKEARLKSGLTREQVAEIVGTTPTYVYMIETGRRLNPSLDVLRKWAKACNVTLSEML